MRARPQLRTWIWPLPPVARRLWGVILGASLYCFAVYLLAGNLISRMPSWSSEFGLVNGIIMGVLVGIRTRASLDRWFEGQRLWGDVGIHARNLSLKVAHLVRADASDRRVFAALVCAFVGAVRDRLRGIDASIEGTPGVDPLPPGACHVPAHLAGRLYALASRWHAEGKCDLPGLWAFEANVRAMMDAAGNCERVAQTPIPMSFHALLRHGLILSLLLAPWHLIHTLGLWAVPVQGFIIYFLFGVELTAEEIENPFGNDVDDLPLGMYCDAIRRDVVDILTAAVDKSPAAPALPNQTSAAIPTVTEEAEE